MGPLIDMFGEYLGSAPIEKPGIQREISAIIF